MADEHSDAASDQQQAERHVEDRSVALQLMLLGVLEAHVGSQSDPLRRLVATHAVSELLGRLLMSEVQQNPAALRSALQILGALRDAVTGEGVAAETTRH